MDEIPYCRHDHNVLAVARFSVDEGCVCFPEDREQDLCAQHIVKWGIIGNWSLLKVYQEDVARDLRLIK